jgi:hypothetical protein
VNRQVPPSAGRGATAGEVVQIPTAQNLVAAYVNAYRGRAGHDPPSRVKGQLAKEIAQLLQDGIPVEAIQAGMREWFALNKHPSTLASFVEVEARGGRARPATRQQQGRAQLIETDQVLDQWVAAKEGGDGDGTTRVAGTSQAAQRELPRPGAPA